METQNILNDDSFARMVAEEVKNKISPLHKQQLMSENNWKRWRDALIALSQNLQDQIGDIENDALLDLKRFSALGQGAARLSQETAKYYDVKAVKIKRFKFHVDNRLDEVCAMMETGKTIQNDGWDQVAFLRRGIAEHRNLIQKFELEETEIDSALWAILDNRWEFDSITAENI